MRRSRFNLRPLLTVWFLLNAAGALAQAKSDLQSIPPIPIEEGRKQARELLSNLLKLRPAENATEMLLVKVTDRNDVSKAVPVAFSIVLTPTNYLSVYEVAGAGTPIQLTIARAQGQPNEYWLRQPATAPPRKLAPNELMSPFAGSDFWMADLGLEFLHWPEQRIIRKQMRKNLFCNVLESINPQPGSNSYSNVVSWIAANRPDDIVIVHAEASDARGKPLKVFDPKKVRKVNGAWELSEMEIRNRQTRSTTQIEFDAGATR